MSIDTPNLGEGSLERLGIPLETQVPSEVLTPNMVRAMRLRRQRPIGYSYEDVDAAKEQYAETSAWFLEALHKRDLDVHRLGGEVDTLQTQVQSLNIELAREAYNAPVREALSQSESDPEVELLGQRVQDLTRRLAEAEAQLAAAQAELQLANARITEMESKGYELGDEDEPQQFVQPHEVPALNDEERAAYESDLAARDERIHELEEGLALEQSRVQALNEYREQTDEYITQIETELEQYENAAGVEHSTPVPPVAIPMPGESFADLRPTDEVDEDEDEDDYDEDDQQVAAAEHETYFAEAAQQDEQVAAASNEPYFPEAAYEAEEPETPYIPVDQHQLTAEELQAIGEESEQSALVDEATAADHWVTEPVAPVGYQSEFDTESDDEPRDTDPEQPSDSEFFEEHETFSAPLDSPEDTAVVQQTVAWNPDLVDDEDEENVPLPARKTTEPADGIANPYTGKPMPPTITLADLED